MDTCCKIEFFKMILIPYKINMAIIHRIDSTEIMSRIICIYNIEI